MALIRLAGGWIEDTQAPNFYSVCSGNFNPDF